MRKIEAMHRFFGTAEGQCKDCSNFVRGRYHDRILQKCSVYGLTHSEASDWTQKWQACGHKDRPPEKYDVPVIKRLRYAPKPPEAPIEGQMEIGGRE